MSKLITPLVAALILLTACDSDTQSDNQSLMQFENSGLEFPVPEKVRTSLAVDFAQVSGVAIVNGIPFELMPLDQRFQARVPDVPVNSNVTVELTFTETLPDGRLLTLAGTDTQNFSIGTSDRTIEIFETQYSYAFDDDNDQISNIAERNDGTDPFVPENTGTRTVTVQFSIPQRINEPDLVQVTALIADVPRPPSREGNIIQASGLVPNISTIDIDIRLAQQFQGQPVLIARAESQVEAGDNNLTFTLPDDQFEFDFDADGDGVLNIDELQAGSNPFEVGQ